MRRDEYKRERRPPRMYPYGYLNWFNQFWQQARSAGYVSAESTPTDCGGLDMAAFLHYFEDGYSPREAMCEELKNI